MNKFTEKAEHALNASVHIAEEMGHTYVGSEHLLAALARETGSCASVLLSRNRLKGDAIPDAIRDYLGCGSKTELSSRDATPSCRRILEASYKTAKRFCAEKIGTEHILYAILEERDCVALKIIARMGCDAVTVKDNVLTFLRATEKTPIATSSATETNMPALTKYGKNMTLAAERGEYAPLIGRDRETERLIRILSRKSKNNPCLVGEAGVGKTAIVEGLAMRIIEGRVPRTLIGKSIYSVDLTSMVAGAKYRGDFEERIKSVLSEASKNKSVILFIDEIHTIVGAGSAEGAIDAANIMKPELARGDIRLIGATTLHEYRKYIEKDSALERRFQPITVEESTECETLNILRGLRPIYESYHGVTITDDAIAAAVTLSERYIQDRFLPDKAIDLLDEACAKENSYISFNSEKIKNIRNKIKQISKDKCNAINNREYELASNLKELERIYTREMNDEIIGGDELCGSRTVDGGSIRDVFTELYGIENFLGVPSTDAGIEERLSEHVLGQSEATRALASAIVRSSVGLGDERRPRGIFLFIGESGVGKTELGRAMSRELFHSDDALIRYDMSEYAEAYAVSKLLGSAPGYVGYDETNSALEKVRKHPYSVVLLDEIEKAHPDVLSLFLQIFDNGFLTDATGRRISFRNTYIVMTSNVGADKFRGRTHAGFLSGGDTEDLREMLREYFKPEFINRIDEVVLFSALDEGTLAAIANKMLSRITERLSRVGILFSYSDDVTLKLASEAMKFRGFGARPLSRLITARIENPLADILATEGIHESDTAAVFVSDGEILVTVAHPAKIYSNDA